jgi:SAM-dependent methyltransferase
MDDLFYRAYEDRHRGSRELIASRLRVYLPFLDPLRGAAGPARALDLGCGRGEWLELLTEQGFAAQGVDLDAGMLAACRQRGLHAWQADAINALRGAPSDSMAVVSAFHVVEHLPFDTVRTMINEALRVLRPGGLLIFETPNAENIVVGSSRFYQDPTHQRPVPLELLDFAVAHAGFHRTKVLRLQEAPALRAPSRVGLLDVLEGVSPDYAVVGQKVAAADVISAFDAPFAGTYGVTLATLAQHYDAQMETRLSDLRGEAARMEGRFTQSQRQTAMMLSHLEKQLEEKLALADQRLAQAEFRAVHAEAHAAQMSARLHDVYASSSWRISAPLRFFAGTTYRLEAAVRDGRLKSGMKRRVKSLVRRLGQAALRRPEVKRPAMWVVKRMPGMEERLRNVLRDPVAAAAMTPEPRQARPVEPGLLPPRAMLIFTELKKTIAARETDAHRH